MKDIAIYGAGGFGREIACLIQMINKSEKKPKWNIVGFFDDNSELKGTKNEYGTILGGISELNEWKSPLDIAIAIGTPDVIKKVTDNIQNPMVEYPNIIAPSVSFLDKDNVRIGKGNILCSGCLISCNIDIGNFNVLNGFIPVGHDTKIGNYNVIMPSCNISGGVQMGDCNFMGVKSTILQYLKVGNNTRIGAGAIVMRNTKDGFLYIGVPATKTEINM